MLDDTQSPLRVGDPLRIAALVLVESKMSRCTDRRAVSRDHCEPGQRMGTGVSVRVCVIQQKEQVSHIQVYV